MKRKKKHQYSIQEKKEIDRNFFELSFRSGLMYGLIFLCDRNYYKYDEIYWRKFSSINMNVEKARNQLRQIIDNTAGRYNKFFHFGRANDPWSTNLLEKVFNRADERASSIFYDIWEKAEQIYPEYMNSLKQEAKFYGRRIKKIQAEGEEDIKWIISEYLILNIYLIPSYDVDQILDKLLSLGFDLKRCREIVQRLHSIYSEISNILKDILVDFSGARRITEENGYDIQCLIEYYFRNSRQFTDIRSLINDEKNCLYEDHIKDMDLRFQDRDEEKKESPNFIISPCMNRKIVEHEYKLFFDSDIIVGLGFNSAFDPDRKAWYQELVKKGVNTDYGITGIYLIHNVDKDKWYVGQSKNVLRRFFEHFREHDHAPDIRQDWMSGDLMTVNYIRLKDTDFNTLNELEKYFIHKYQCLTKGYNSVDV